MSGPHGDGRRSRSTRAATTSAAPRHATERDYAWDASREDLHAARDADGDDRPSSRKVPVTRLTARREPCRARPRYSRSAVARARDVRPDLVVVVGLLAEGRDVDDADAGRARARARSSGSASRRRASTGRPFSNSPGCTSPSASTRSGPTSAGDGGAERDAEHRGGVGRQAGREVDVEHDHAAFRGLSGHGAAR